MPLTDYITLGNSGLRVSPMCLGTMTFGNDWGVVGTNIEESLDVLGAYLDRGGNFLDTANAYTKGHSEKNHWGLLRQQPGQARPNSHRD